MLQDLLCVEARVVRPTQFANYLTIHRKGVPGDDDGEPLAYELRCFPNRDQVRLEIADSTECANHLLVGDKTNAIGHLWPIVLLAA